MSDSISKTFSYNQALSVVVLLRMILSRCHEYPKREHALVRTMIEFDLNENQYNSFTNEIVKEPAILTAHLKSLDSLQRSYLILSAWEVLSCTGNFSEQEFLSTLEVVDKVAGIDNDYFMDTIEKMNNLAAFSDTKIKKQVTRSEIKEEPLISGQSLVFIIIMALAILGLVSLCKK